MRFSSYLRIRKKEKPVNIAHGDAISRKGAAVGNGDRANRTVKHGGPCNSHFNLPERGRKPQLGAHRLTFTKKASETIGSDSRTVRHDNPKHATTWTYSKSQTNSSAK